MHTTKICSQFDKALIIQQALMSGLVIGWFLEKFGNELSKNKVKQRLKHHKLIAITEEEGNLHHKLC
jgi:hypothetical protein